MNLGLSLLTGAMALALSVPAAAQTTELAPGMTASVTAGVNLRAGPGSRHKRVDVSSGMVNAQAAGPLKFRAID